MPKVEKTTVEMTHYDIKLKEPEPCALCEEPHNANHLVRFLFNGKFFDSMICELCKEVIFSTKKLALDLQELEKK